jgi:glycosyltransferase involved in cell wall biosynthesis
MEKLPEISIVVPCYNQAEYLDECLQSVLDQIYQNWECILVNDGSPDNTEEVALLWTQKDSRFKYLKKENGGLSSARNAGIEKAAGKFILPLDCDDKISVDYVSEAVKVFEKKPTTTLVYCKAWLFGSEEGLWNLPEYNYFEMLFGNRIFCSAVFKKEDWMRVKGYDETMKIGLEDWDFWLRILNKESIVVKLPIVGFYYRQKTVSMITEFIVNQNRKKNENYIFQKQIPVIETYFEHSLPYCLHNFSLLEKNMFELKNDYKVLAKQVKISNLFKAACFKFMYILKKKIFR